jgi:dodecin
MPNHIYKVIELVGTSEAGVTQAIDEAISRANQSIKGLDWFEVGEIRGEIENGKPAYYQVAVKIGFRVMSHEELQG